jgi:hypothetical protein
MDLAKKELSYEVCVLYAAPVSEGLEEAEKFWISQLRPQLFNMSDGGDGTLGSKRSIDSRMKASVSHGGLSFETQLDLCAAYRMGESTPRLSKRYKIARHVAWKILKRHGVVLRTKSEARKLGYC